MRPLILLLLLLTTPVSADTRRLTEADFLSARLRVEAVEVGTGETVRTLIGCLGQFGGDAPRPVKVTQARNDVFRLAVELRSTTQMTFVMQTHEGTDYAVLTRIEYKVGQRGYAQIVDAAAKRLILHQVCLTPPVVSFPP